MDESLQMFLDYLKIRGELSVEHSARSVLVRMKRWSMERDCESWSDIDARLLDEWVAEQSRVLSPRSILNYVARVRRFFGWLEREGLVLKSPVSADLGRCRECRSVIHPPSEEEMCHILDQVCHDSSNASRNLAMMELMYSTGLRRLETASLDVKDLRCGELKVKGKGCKERMVPVGKEAWECVWDYMNGERAHVVVRHGECEALFLSQYGGRLSAQGVYVALKKHLVGGVHMLRRACATHMLRHGAPMETLRRLLGHEHLSTTQSYTAVCVEDLKRELLNRHPGW